MLWAENINPSWRVRGSLTAFCNIHNKNIYNENCKNAYVWLYLFSDWYNKIQYNKENSSFQQRSQYYISAAQQQISVRGPFFLLRGRTLVQLVAITADTSFFFVSVTTFGNKLQLRNFFSLILYDTIICQSLSNVTSFVGHCSMQINTS